MLRPGGSHLSLRAIGSSIRNLNSISNERLDERLLLLMPPPISSSSKRDDNDKLSVYEFPTNSARSKKNNLAVQTASGSTVNLNQRKDLNDMIHSTSSLKNTTTSVLVDSSKNLDQLHEKQDDGLESYQQQQQQQIQQQHSETNDKEQQLTEVYFKRWIILGVFCLITLLSAFNWIEYGIIQDVTIFFYNQSLPETEAKQVDAVNWFSMVYMLAYIPLVFPAMFLLERKGLKLSCILGAFLTFAGAAVKCAAVRPDLFAVAMLGQTICAIGQAFTLGVPARLSALWFGPNQIGLATSIGVFGNQLGTALGFLIPPSIVTKNESFEFMQKRFYILLIPVAALSALSLLLALLIVKDQPEKAPSLAQLEVRNTYSQKDEQENDFKIFKSSLINLFKNFNFCLILISYGINTGVYYSISTLLNLIISKYYQNENEKIGIIGLILVLSGLIGAVVGGILLDKTKAFKLITFIIYAFSFGAMVLFTFTLEINIWIIFATSFMLGFFMTGYLPVGFELAAEVTYPASEGTSCGLLNTSAQIFGIFFTYVQSRITVTVSALAGNIFVSSALLIGTIITAIVKSDLRRQRAINIIIEKTPSKNKNPIQIVINSQNDEDITI